MMGGTPAMDYSLQQVLQRIEKSRLRKRPLRRAIEQLDENPKQWIYTSSHGYQPIREAARYWFMLALVWRLLNDDAAAEDKLEKARACKDCRRRPLFEAGVLYEHVTLFIRHGWRLDMVPVLFERIVALYEGKPELTARTLTNWGKFLYNQKKYGEAHEKLIDAESRWTDIQGQLGHVMSPAEKRHMAETNWLLLKTLAAQKADPATINRVAQKTIRLDRNVARKVAAAAKFRRITNKASNG